MVSFKNIENVKSLFCLIDYYTLNQYLEGEKSPFELSETLSTVREKGCTPAAKQLLALLNASSKADRKEIINGLKIDPEDLGKPPVFKASVIYKYLLYNPQTSSDLRTALAKVEDLKISQKTKQVLRDLLRVLDRLDLEKTFIDDDSGPKRLSKQFMPTFKDKGTVPAIKEVFHAVEESGDAKNIAAQFTLTGKVSPKLIMQKILNKPDDTDLAPALIAIGEPPPVDAPPIDRTNLKAMKISLKVQCQPPKPGQLDVRNQVECKKFEEMQELSIPKRINALISEKRKSMGDQLSRAGIASLEFSLDIKFMPDGKAIVLKINHKKYDFNDELGSRAKTFMDKVVTIIESIDFQYVDLQEPLMMKNYPFEF